METELEKLQRIKERFDFYQKVYEDQGTIGDRITRRKNFILRYTSLEPVLLGFV